MDPRLPQPLFAQRLMCQHRQHLVQTLNAIQALRQHEQPQPPAKLPRLRCAALHPTYHHAVTPAAVVLPHSDCALQVRIQARVGASENVRRAGEGAGEGAGMGGTVTGLARGLRKKKDKAGSGGGVIVVFVDIDPKGSVVALSESLKGEMCEYEVVSTSYNFVPAVLDRNAPDLWVKTEDGGSFWVGRGLVSEKGLLCGGIVMSLLLP